MHPEGGVTAPSSTEPIGPRAMTTGNTTRHAPSRFKPGKRIREGSARYFFTVNGSAYAASAHMNFSVPAPLPFSPLSMAMVN